LQAVSAVKFENEKGNEIENRRPQHRHAGRQHPGGNDGRNRIGRIMKAIDEIEGKGDQDNEGDDEKGGLMKKFHE
jgi:hypothetical protein